MDPASSIRHHRRIGHLAGALTGHLYQANKINEPDCGEPPNESLVLEGKSQKGESAGKSKMKDESIKSPYLIVGLGNPGRQFQKDRHNIGFMVINRLAERMDLEFDRVQNKAIITAGHLSGHRVLLAKPQTFMNKSGDCISSLKRSAHIPLDHLLIIFDDLDLPLGTIRMRPKGGSGGHRGMNSIIERFGIEDFPRMRLGIGRPPDQMEPADFVLQAFSKSELPLVEMVLDRAGDCIQTYICEGIETAMTRYNSSVEGEWT